MKARIYSQIKTLVDIRVDFSDRIIPIGTVGTIVECYRQPEGYAVDIAMPNHQLIGGYEYDNVILQPDQFSVMQETESSEATMQVESRS
ncbi:MAG: DUF4926 domain-containing protein [Tildeniella nuda ZEHNDER 1965/U140]|jgi:hypothetical protein|nr:DUF4926 domain-containing protein [Tildeniella nuda ZEHNDER 1965/U140]